MKGALRRKRRMVKRQGQTLSASTVLVAAYRGSCREWILRSRLYNVPFHRDNCEAEKCRRIGGAFLCGDDGTKILCTLEFDRVVSRHELVALGYPSKLPAHSDKYVLFRIVRELSEEEAVSIRATAENRFFVVADAYSRNRDAHLKRLNTFLERFGRVGPREDEEEPINVDSMWIIGPRAKGEKRFNNYHGNFVPQIPNNLIRRYTEVGDVVLDMFMGSGTTLFECERLRRNFIGFDINQPIIDFVESQMSAQAKDKYAIHNCDVTDEKLVAENVCRDLARFRKNCVDFVLMHPPYLDIIKFTDRADDLSSISDVVEFSRRFGDAVEGCLRFLAPRKYFALVVGDLYRNSEVLPLGFRMMEEVKRRVNCKLKGIVVKDMVGNRAKIGQEALWKARALRGGYYLFKHEYVFVFRKEK